MSSHECFDAVIFDMDGVLIDATEWHYEALNRALSKFGELIERDDHIRRFNGLPTKSKLAILSQDRGLPIALHDQISNLKQIETLRIGAANSKVNLELLKLLEHLKLMGIRMAVATNSIRMTTEVFLHLAGIRDYFDVVTTNQDVSRPKPHPEIYIKTCDGLQVAASRTLVIEDSEFGVNSAIAAGCKVLRVSGVEDVYLENLQKRFEVEGC